MVGQFACVFARVVFGVPGLATPPDLVPFFLCFSHELFLPRPARPSHLLNPSTTKSDKIVFSGFGVKR